MTPSFRRWGSASVMGALILLLLVISGFISMSIGAQGVGDGECRHSSPTTDSFNSDEIHVSVGLLVNSLTDMESNQTSEVMHLAIEEINRNQSLQYRSNGGVNWLMTSAIRATNWQRFGALEASLSLLHTHRSMAIVGMSTESSAALIGPTAGAVGVPAIATAITNRDVHKTAYYPTFMRACSADNMLPVVLKDLLLHYGWHEIGMIYSSAVSGFHALNDASELAPTFGIKVSDRILVQFDGKVDPLTVQKINLSAGTRTQMKTMKDSGVKIIVLNVHSSELLSVLRHASQLGMLSKGYALILLRLFPSLHQLPLEVIRLLQGALAFRPKIDDEKAARLAVTLNQRRPSVCPDGKAGCLAVQAVYTYDATIALGHAFSKWINTTGVPSADPCAVTLPGAHKPLGLPKWRNISGLVDALRNSGPSSGVGGSLSLENDNAEADYNIVNIVNGSLVVIGDWTRRSALDLSRVDAEKQTVEWTGGTSEVPSTRGFLNQRLNVSAPVSEPFVYPPRTLVNYTNDDFRGIAIDLLKEVARLTGFNYTLHPWDSSSESVTDLIRSVGDQSSSFDLVASSLTVTSERSKLCTFTKSIFLSSLRILIKDPVDNGFDFFRVFQPFDIWVWVMMLVTLLISGVIITYLDPANVATERKKSELGDGLFFSFMSFFSAHNGDAVKTSLSRTFLLVIQFTNLILSTMYTAHMTAYLTGKVAHDITGYSDLYNQRVACRYGTEDWDYVTEKLGLRHVVAVRNQDEALAALRSGDVVAYIAEKPHIAKLASEEEDMIVIGGEVDTQQFAFALTKGSPWELEIDRTLGRLVTQGKVTELYLKYVPRKAKTGADDDDARSITAKDVYSIFLLPLGTFLVLLALPLRRIYYLRPKKKQKYQMRLASNRTSAAALVENRIRQGAMSDFPDQVGEEWNQATIIANSADCLDMAGSNHVVVTNDL